MKIAINTCFGGFSLSDAAYEHLTTLGVPVRPYIHQKRDQKEPLNDELVIFDRDITEPRERETPELRASMRRLCGRYWWSRDLDEERTCPLVIQTIETLGDAANGKYAKLRIVEIPDDVDWEIDDYDGNETIREKSRAWR